MTAVIGFDANQLQALVDSSDGVVIANDNSSSQVVLSGTPQAVESVCGQLKCKRSIPLAVSGAFHSPMMDQASMAVSVSQISIQRESGPKCVIKK